MPNYYSLLLDICNKYPDPEIVQMVINKLPKTIAGDTTLLPAVYERAGSNSNDFKIEDLPLRYKTSKVLLKNGANPNFGLVSILNFGCAYSLKRELLLFVKYGADVNYTMPCETNIATITLSSSKYRPQFIYLMANLGTDYNNTQNDCWKYRIGYIEHFHKQVCIEKIRVRTLRTLCIRTIYKNWLLLKKTQKEELKGFPKVLLEFPDESKETEEYNNRIENYNLSAKKLNK